ncbi:hypothetical protein F6V30_14155 [Oryzomonas sagensis]|uniref:Uncharacterized protein n=1 Tax=Oryzomonas sagensis TaxID=2603857 RepID=A0ABQ6TLT2_9BACT|nr:hypothetical protein [Oryzomonas sagensis]KAB0668976.1 hypothetical protein F6V30_14155 [Oryzomonas sagensis]
MIDLVETRKRFDETGRKMATWAKQRNFDPVRFRNTLNGTVKINQEEINALKEDNLLVERGSV